MQKRALVIALAIAVSACESDEPDQPADAPRAQQADPAVASARAPQGLTPVASCEALGETLRARMLAEMRARIARERAAHPSGCYRDAGVLRGNCPTCGPSLPMAPSSRPVADAPTSVSRTNNQVAGVDEADMVKTVDGVLYVATDAGLHVIAAWPADRAHEIARVKIAGTPKQLFVENGRAVVYSSLGNPTGRACTYGYECDFLGDGTKTHLTVLDVRTPSAPRVVRELDLSGALIAARRIGDTVHTVVAEPDQVLPLRYSPPSCAPMEPQQRDEAFAKLERENAELIQKADLRSLVPNVSDTAAPNAPLTCGGFIVPTKPSGGSYTSVVSFDLAGSAPVANTTVIGRPGAVYVSEQSLYMAVRTPDQQSETSVVHRFRVGDRPSSTRYEASGVVPGHALNQFAMDEYQGNLRIATTTGRVPDPNTVSTFSVLSQRGGALEVVGQVGQIAPTEDIRSVRFAGPRGYVVTFKKTDPLFVVDLADPRAPKLLGELKIPGFSTYMQPLDERNLLTIGYDAEDHGDFAFFQGVLLQIFDVGDPSQPRLRHKAVIGTRGSSSEALTNHLAFNYFADKQLLAVPMTICEGQQGGSSYGTMTFSGLMLFDVKLDTGIVERGRVAHPPLATGKYNDASCSNWWTNATSNVKRSVFMDDFVYSIAPDVVRVQSLSRLGRDVATVPLNLAWAPQQSDRF